MLDVRLIAAVGRSGQLGLGGKLPWHDPLDLKGFREATMGGVVLMGARTYDSVGRLPGRETARWSGKTPPYAVLTQLHYRFGKTIWIGGGAWTYQSFMPYVRTAIITRIDYDGEADTFMPTLWGPRYAIGDTSSHNATLTSGAGTLSASGSPSGDNPQPARDSGAVRRKRRSWHRRARTD